MISEKLQAGRRRAVMAWLIASRATQKYFGLRSAHRLLASTVLGLVPWTLMSRESRPRLIQKPAAELTEIGEGNLRGCPAVVSPVLAIRSLQAAASASCRGSAWLRCSRAPESSSRPIRCSWRAGTSGCWWLIGGEPVEVDDRLVGCQPICHGNASSEPPRRFGAQERLLGGMGLKSFRHCTASSGAVSFGRFSQVQIDHGRL